MARTREQFEEGYAQAGAKNRHPEWPALLRLVDQKDPAWKLWVSTIRQGFYSNLPGKQMQEPPFRVDHVGSFLRPKFLLDAREQFWNQDISSEQLREVENRAIRDIVKFQENLGLEGITDGEYRRTYFHKDFLTQLRVVGTEGGINVSFKTADGWINFAPPVMKVEGKVSHLLSI